MINLKDITSELISLKLSKYFIENEVDDEGDIAISDTYRVYIRIMPEDKMLRFYSFISPEQVSGVVEDKFDIFLNYINGANYYVKFSKLKIMDNISPLLCEHVMSIEGEVSDEFIIKTIRAIQKEILKSIGVSVKFESVLAGYNHAMENHKSA